MMNGTNVGLLHPGEMGAALGHCLSARGHTVLWASQGRSPDTAERAAAAGLTDTGTVAELARRAEVVLSVCPPHAARSVAEGVRGFGGIYVDANAISPQTARSVANIVGGGAAGESGPARARAGTAGQASAGPAERGRAERGRAERGRRAGPTGAGPTGAGPTGAGRQRVRRRGDRRAAAPARWST